MTANAHTHTSLASQTPGSQLATVKGLLSMDSYKKRFEEVLGKRAAAFMASVSNASQMTHLAECDPKSVIASAFIAATLDLPVDKNLGFAHLVPYRAGGGKPICQLQVGYKGFMQLAFRTGQYRQFNDCLIPEGVFIKHNELTGDLELDWDAKKSDEAMGYAVFFRTANGFEKTVYWSKAKVLAHAKRYSKAFGKASSPWTTQFDAMALKTVIKFTLAKYGLLSIEMQNALTHDQGAQSDIDAPVQHVDGSGIFTDIESAEPESSPTDGIKATEKATAQDDSNADLVEAPQSAPEAEKKPMSEPEPASGFDRPSIMLELQDKLNAAGVTPDQLFHYAKSVDLVKASEDGLWKLPTAALAKLRFAVNSLKRRGGAS